MTIRSAIQVDKSESQAGSPRLTISLAAFVLVCFFLPWLEVSCFGMREAASGFSLAREGERELWLAPLAMLLVLLAGLVYSIRRSTLAIFALVSMVGGGLSAWLMFRERAGIGEGTGLVSAHWTVWFWLAAAASVGVAASALSFYVKRSRAP